MKKFALAVVVAAIAVSPAMAAKKHHKKKVAAQPASVAELNDNGFRFVRDSLPIYLPTVVKMVIYPVGNHQK